jgi:hypothetical protein
VFRARAKGLQTTKPPLVLSRHLPGSFGWDWGDNLKLAQQDEIDARVLADLERIDDEVIAGGLLVSFFLGFGVPAGSLPVIVRRGSDFAASKQEFVKYVQKTR